MNKSISKNLLLIILSISLFNSQVLACCMVPSDYDGSIRQNEQQGIVFYKDGVQDLILGINYQITGNKMPSEFAWIVSIPSKPEAYDLADRKLFEKTSQWASKLTHRPKLSFAVGAPKATRAVPQSVQFDKREKIGPYDIQPVRGLGVEALAPLNEWLAQNGFPVEPEEHMRYFLQNGFTFLCIKVSAAEAGDLNPSESLKPLKITFKSDRPYYPLKYSSRQGNFKLNLITITDSPISYDLSASRLNRINYDTDRKKNVEIKRKRLPKRLRKSLDRMDRDVYYLNQFRSGGFNQNQEITKWKNDLFMTLKG